MAEFAPCPTCSSKEAKQVGFTWWGGILGPRILSHVKCQECGTKYNGKTGKSNTTGIIVYSAVCFGIAIAVLIVAFLLGH